MIDVLKKCDKKILLKIDQFNKNSFDNKNIFKVVYIICHTEIVEKNKNNTKT
jgi:hypothetical protein